MCQPEHGILPITVYQTYHVRGNNTLSQIDVNKLDEIMTDSYDPTLVIGIMQDIQKEYHYLPQDALSYVAKKLKISEAKIYGVATFYENFSLEPKGKYIIKVCDGTACHVRQSTPIFTVETVSCLGACGLAPVCTVNDHVHPSMTPEKARQMLDEIYEKEGLKK